MRDPREFHPGLDTSDTMPDENDADWLKDVDPEPAEDFNDGFGGFLVLAIVLLILIAFGV